MRILVVEPVGSPHEDRITEEAKTDEESRHLDEHVTRRERGCQETGGEHTGQTQTRVQPMKGRRRRQRATQELSFNVTYRNTEKMITYLPNRSYVSVMSLTTRIAILAPLRTS